MSASAAGSGPSPSTFLCPISHEIMSEPVVAVDGHSYEKSAIEQWFATGKRSSPMTNKAMASTALTPNRLLKSQISEWQGRSNAERVGELVTAVMTAGVMTTDPKAVEGKLLDLARFVGQNKAVVQPATLDALSSMLQGFQKLWVAPVRQALRAAEAECKLVVAGLAAQLRDERRDEGLAAEAATAAAGKRAQLDIEIAAAKEALEKLEEERTKHEQDAVALQRVEADCGARAAQLEQELAGYPEPLSLLDEGKEVEQGGGSARQTRSKRKRADEEEGQLPVTEVAKRQRGDGGSAQLDCEALMQEGLQWFRGSHFRAQDKVRGRLLIETAAAGGLPLAVARCQFEGWGSNMGAKQVAFKALQELSSVETSSWIVMEAQHRLGFCYQNGEGVEQDEAEAVKWYRKAAEQGHSQAQINLGICYDNGQGVEEERTEAMKWYRKAAEQGHSEAQFNLGICYDNDVEMDVAEAVKWYREAAEQGHSQAQFCLGSAYKFGEGVDKDEAEAVKWYRKAAEQGTRPAIRVLVRRYQRGIGVEKDEAEASRWQQQLE
jgi:TPR repeat protein